MTNPKPLTLAIAAYAIVGVLTFGRAYVEQNPFSNAALPHAANGFRIMGSTLFWPFYWSIEAAQQSGAQK